jgi:hypothetical protein
MTLHYIMASIQNLLNTANMIAKIGKVADMKAPAQKENINIAKMGYPSSKMSSMRHESVKSHPIHTEKSIEKHRQERIEQYSKIDNSQGLRFINTNLSSQENKPIMDEIDMLIEKIRDNFETGAFFYLVVGDTYKLLQLFEKNIYKFDSIVLNDYYTYLSDLYEIIENGVDSDLYKVIGTDKQVNNLVTLVGKIFSRILELCEVMQNNADKSPNEKKLIVNAQLKLKKFTSIDKRYLDTIKSDYDDEMKKLKKQELSKNNKNVKQLKEQTALLKELLTEAQSARKGSNKDDDNSSPLRPVSIAPFTPAKDRKSPEVPPPTKYFDIYTGIPFPKDIAVQEKNDVAKRVESLYKKLEEYKKAGLKDKYNDLKGQLEVLNKFRDEYRFFKDYLYGILSDSTDDYQDSAYTQGLSDNLDKLIQLKSDYDAEGNKEKFDELSKDMKDLLDPNNKPNTEKFDKLYYGIVKKYLQEDEIPIPFDYLVKESRKIPEHVVDGENKEPEAVNMPLEDEDEDEDEERDLDYYKEGNGNNFSGAFDYFFNVMTSKPIKIPEKDYSKLNIVNYGRWIAVKVPRIQYNKLIDDGLLNKGKISKGEFGNVNIKTLESNYDLYKQVLGEIEAIGFVFKGVNIEIFSDDLMTFDGYSLYQLANIDKIPRVFNQTYINISGRGFQPKTPPDARKLKIIEVLQNLIKDAEAESASLQIYPLYE